MDDAELDRTLKAAVSVTPSPEFAEKVRRAIAEDSAVSPILRWVVPAAAAAVLVLVVVVVTNRNQGQPLQIDIPSAQFAGADIVLPSPSTDVRDSQTSAMTGKVVSRARIPAATKREEPVFEVMFSPADAEAYRRLFSSVGSMPYELSGEAVAEDQTIAAIDFAPIVIEPQVDISFDKGVFQ
jgi:hypothetical protein